MCLLSCMYALLMPSNCAATAMEGEDPNAYLIHRLMHGVPDGPDDLPEGSSLPLEANIDWMGGGEWPSASASFSSCLTPHTQSTTGKAAT